jgi:hypothetical protein
MSRCSNLICEEEAGGEVLPCRNAVLSEDFDSSSMTEPASSPSAVSRQAARGITVSSDKRQAEKPTRIEAETVPSLL